MSKLKTQFIRRDKQRRLRVVDGYLLLFVKEKRRVEQLKETCCYL